MNEHYDEQTIHEYVDGRLPEAAGTVLRMHLAVCPACASLHLGAVTVDGILRRIPRDQAGPQMAEAVLARIMFPRNATRLDRMLRPRFLVSAVLALFGTVGGIGAVVTAGEPGRGTGVLTGAERVLRALLDAAGVQAETIGGMITSMAPHLFSAEALQITLAIVVLAPLFLCADHLLAKRRLTG